MIEREELIAIGKFIKAHGLSGELVAELDVDNDVMSQLDMVVLAIDGIFVPFFITSLRPRGTVSSLLMLDGVNDDTAAAALAGQEIFILKRDYDTLVDENDADEQMPIDYFTGYTLMNANNGETVGIITDVDDTTINVLFIVERPDGSIVRVPAVDDLVEIINDDSRVISMYIPGGLLDL